MYCVQKYPTALHKFNTTLNLYASLLVLNVLYIALLLPMNYGLTKSRGYQSLPVKQALFLSRFRLYVASLLATDGDGRSPPVL